MNKIIRLTNTEFKDLKDIAKQEGRKQALKDVKKIIYKFRNDYGDFGDLDSLEEKLKKLEK